MGYPQRTTSQPANGQASAAWQRWTIYQEASLAHLRFQRLNPCSQLFYTVAQCVQKRRDIDRLEIGHRNAINGAGSGEYHLRENRLQLLRDKADIGRLDLGLLGMIGTVVTLVGIDDGPELKDRLEAPLILADDVLDANVRGRRPRATTRLVGLYSDRQVAGQRDVAVRAVNDDWLADDRAGIAAAIEGKIRTGVAGPLGRGVAHFNQPAGRPRGGAVDRPRRPGRPIDDQPAVGDRHRPVEIDIAVGPSDGERSAEAGASI